MYNFLFVFDDMVFLNIVGLFRYAVIQSGSPLAFWAVARKEWPEGYNIDEKDIKKKHKNYLKTLDGKTIKEIKAKVGISY